MYVFTRAHVYIYTSTTQTKPSFRMHTLPRSHMCHGNRQRGTHAGFGLAKGLLWLCRSVCVDDGGQGRGGEGEEEEEGEDRSHRTSGNRHGCGFDSECASV